MTHKIVWITNSNLLSPFGICSSRISLGGGVRPGFLKGANPLCCWHSSLRHSEGPMRRGSISRTSPLFYLDRSNDSMTRAFLMQLSHFIAQLCGAATAITIDAAAPMGIHTHILRRTLGRSHAGSITEPAPRFPSLSHRLSLETGSVLLAPHPHPRVVLLRCRGSAATVARASCVTHPSVMTSAATGEGGGCVWGAADREAGSPFVAVSWKHRARYGTSALPPPPSAMVQ